MTKTFITNKFEETQRLGLKFAGTLKGGDVLALHGDLGSGKTTFVQGLAKGLGIEKKIISPTFIIVREYEAPLYSSSEQRESRSSSSRQTRTRSFYHIDLYRIESEEEVEGLGLEEILQDPESIVVIEWPEKVKGILPKTRIDIYFEYVDEEKREIKISE